MSFFSLLQTFFRINCCNATPLLNIYSCAFACTHCTCIYIFYLRHEDTDTPVAHIQRQRLTVGKTGLSWLYCSVYIINNRCAVQTRPLPLPLPSPYVCCRTFWKQILDLDAPSGSAECPLLTISGVTQKMSKILLVYWQFCSQETVGDQRQRQSLVNFLFGCFNKKPVQFIKKEILINGIQ